MQKKTVLEFIVTCSVARENCIESGNEVWRERWEDALDQAENLLPSGSGINCGTKIESATAEKVVLSLWLHHMDEHGYYDGWTEHEVIVKPSFLGLNIRVTGKNRNGIKEYLVELYDSALSELVEWDGETVQLARYANAS